MNHRAFVALTGLGLVLSFLPRSSAQTDEEPKVGWPPGKPPRALDPHCSSKWVAVSVEPAAEDGTSVIVVKIGRSVLGQPEGERATAIIIYDQNEERVGEIPVNVRATYRFYTVPGVLVLGSGSNEASVTIFSKKAGERIAIAGADAPGLNLSYPETFEDGKVTIHTRVTNPAAALAGGNIELIVRSSGDSQDHEVVIPFVFSAS